MGHQSASVAALPDGSSDPVQQALKAHSARVDDAVKRFMRDLALVLAIAQTRLGHKLMRSLKLGPDLAILALPANQKILRKLSALWQESLDEAGLDHAIAEYLTNYPQQVYEFISILQAVNHQATTPLPLPKFSQADKEYFAAVQGSAGADIAATVEGAAQNVLSRTIYSAGGMSFRTLTETLVERTNASVANAETIADTSLMAFYRGVANRGYERIEASTKRTIRYDYLGPLDRITRAVCIHWLARSKERPFTRKEIDNLSAGPGQPGPPMICGGGYNCRHSFNVSLRQDWEMIDTAQAA